MSQQKLKAILDSEIDNSIGFLETETTQQRTDALSFYLRQPLGNEVEGKSAIVTGEVAEAVERWLRGLSAPRTRVAAERTRSHLRHEVVFRRALRLRREQAPGRATVARHSRLRRCYRGG